MQQPRQPSKIKIRIRFPVFNWFWKTDYQLWIDFTTLVGTEVECWPLEWLCFRENTISSELALDGFAGSQEESSGSQESLSAVNVNELIQVCKFFCISYGMEKI